MTVVYNFHIVQPNETTVVRFFGQPHGDLVNWLVKNVLWPADLAKTRYPDVLIGCSGWLAEVVKTI